MVAQKKRGESTSHSRGGYERERQSDRSADEVSEEEAALGVLETLSRGLNTRNPAVVASAFAEDAVLHGMALDKPVRGRPAITRHYEFGLAVVQWVFLTVAFEARTPWYVAESEIATRGPNPAPVPLGVASVLLSPTSFRMTIIFRMNHERLISDCRLALGPPDMYRPSHPAIAAGTREAQGAPLERLTPREVEVLRLLATGADNRRIAHLAGVSVNTVRFHLTNIFQKLHVRTRTEAVRVDRQRGIQ